jgi:heparan-alpha-glucosaminide N-acetyltransferase
VAPVNVLVAGRAASIDALRGLTFVAMIFVNELGGVSGISPWLKHMPADADAMSFPDVVFPAFLFIVGMAIPFSINARLDQGDDALGVQRHILYRAFALVVMGFFMVNAESGFAAQAMPVSIHVWSLLFYAAVFLCWGVWRFENRAVTRALRVAGALLIVLLALLYRGEPDGRGGMTPQWWGILGLIGWAYFYSCELYLLSRGRLAAVLGWLLFCIVYYVAAHRAGLPPAFAWLFSQHAHAAHSQIVLAGVACTLIFFDASRAVPARRRFDEAALFALGLAIAATALRPFFPISKINATPSWCLYCAAICVALFAALHALVDVAGHTRWMRWIEPAAANPLVTYLLPFVVVALLGWAGLELPPALRHGAGGLAWAALYVALVVACVALLARRGVRLRL